MRLCALPLYAGGVMSFSLEIEVSLLSVLMDVLVDKLADYEDELRQLKSSSQNDQNLSIPPQSLSRPSSAPGSHPSRTNLPARLSNLLPSSRRATSQLPDPPLTPGHLPSTSADLLTLLTKEQTLRQAAESRVSQTNDELEELSAQLFTEANEMVATERKARAKLEERVAILEGRDKEKRGRLEMLESRLGRIERVRGLLSREQAN
ncbi:hypothetical protein OEA41_001433 [Lepraria neglecta]|uniref:GDP/GTP exchange factor Sec2 N-terminal domain-containing protein n=1 Tax=Lepraria neglecta TaxID=209136 RepID=A0AAD9ZA21_9LECA|nr:hypothetical protein OEA41_001433 [Lepraria neglecta]